MTKSRFSVMKWLIPALFVLLGVLFYTAVHGHSFLGLVCFGIAGVISCYYLLALLKKHGLGMARVLTAVLTVLLCAGILAFAVTQAIIVRASEGDTQTHCKYLAVLGAKVNGTSPSLSLHDRIQAAYAYLTEHPDTVAVLSGGKGSDEQISEAQCMFNELTALGIDPQRLWMEDQATSTVENLQFSLELIEEKTGQRPDTLGVLSSEYHLYRAGLMARDCGVEMVGIPADTSWLSIQINYSMREVVCVWYYILFGG